MKVFKSKVERLLIVALAAFLGVWTTGQAHLGSDPVEVRQGVDWVFAVILPAFLLFLPFMILTVIMPRVSVTPDAIQLKALWGLLLIQTIRYSEIQQVSITQMGESLKIIVDKKDQQNITIQYLKKDQVQNLLEILQPYTQMNSQPANTITPFALDSDVGQRVLVIAAFSVTLGIFDVFLGKLHQAWHNSSENMFHWLIISIPLAMALIYPYIKAEKKAHPMLSSIVVGLLLGAALNFWFLQSLRWWNEQHPMPTQVLAFTLVEKEQHRQKWQPVAGNPLDFHDGYVWVHDVWKEGFNPALKQGQTYHIAVVQGRLNDIYFPVQAFHNAKQIDP